MKTAMKKTSRILMAALLMGFLLASCSSNRGFVSSVKRSEIKQVQQFEPLSLVGVVFDGDRMVYSDTLSLVAQGLLETALTKDETLPVTGKMDIDDEDISSRVAIEIYQMMNLIEGRTRVQDIPLPPTIDSILEARSERFGLLAYSRGFVRTEDSYDKAFGKGAALTLLTLGSYTVIPHKYETHGGVIIVDSLNDNIAYVTTGAFEYHPLKADTYKKLMIELVRVFRKRYS